MPAGDGGLRGLLVVLSDNHHCVLDQGRPGGRGGAGSLVFLLLNACFQLGRLPPSLGNRARRGRFADDRLRIQEAGRDCPKYQGSKPAGCKKPTVCVTASHSLVRGVTPRQGRDLKGLASPAQAWSSAPWGRKGKAGAHLLVLDCFEGEFLPFPPKTPVFLRYH